MLTPGMPPPPMEMPPWGDDITGPPPPTTANTGGPAAIAEAQMAWRERERRQRTVRFLVMFLLMLLLMDGEEQQNQQRRKSNDPNFSNHLRKRIRSKDGNKYYHYYLEESLYNQRTKQEQRILKLTSKHTRYKQLIQKNSNIDHEINVREWAQQHAELQKDEFLVPPNIKEPLLLSENDNNNDNDNNNNKDPEEEKIILHYPWNATGFYRGEWVRHDESKTDNDSDKTNTSTTNKHNDDDTIDENSNSKKSKKKNNEDESSSSSSSSSSPKLKNAVEMEKKMLQILKDSKESIGVYLLPNGYELLLANATITSTEDGDDSRSNSNKGIYASQNNHQPPFLRINNVDQSSSSSLSSQQYNRHPRKVGGDLRITLSKSTGRAAFQLYSRTVPAIKEITLLDGFVKLYDSNTVGYSTRRDILLRVSGVIIHSIGRISLVSNAPPGRSALVIGDNSSINNHQQQQKQKQQQKQQQQQQHNDNNNKKENSHDDKSDNNEDTHRRLLQLIASTTQTNPIDDTNHNIEQIRDDALSLYNVVDDYDDEKEENSGWTLTTPDFGLLNEVMLLNSNDESKNYYNDNNNNEFLHRRLSSTSTTTSKQKKVKKDVVTAESEVGMDENVSTTKGKTKSTNRSDKATKKSQISDEKSSKGDSLPTSKFVIPYPFVPDDEELSVRRTRTPASRRMPHGEQLLEANAGSCEFQINMDVQEEEWTIGQWRSLLGRHVKQAMELDPSNHNDSVDDEEDEEDSSNTKKKKKSGIGKSKSIKSSSSNLPNRKPIEDEALVMTMLGTIESPNCDFVAALNVTAIRTDWEHTTGKAINYSFYMMLACLTQIVVLLRQLLHTQAQSAATRVSLLCIGWQTVLDALLCLVHIYLSLAMHPLFTAFASVAFFKLLIFCVIEMKYMAIIIQARNASNGGNTLELLRRQIAMLHLRFYVALIGSFLAFFYAGETYRTLYVLVLYSFWVPQIVQNVITEAKRPLHTHYIYGMSWTRLVAPLYIFAVPKNFLKEVYPDSPTNPFMCQLLFLWIAIQTAVLIAQGKYGARFMIPARFLPPKFDYSRPIPPSLLPPNATIVELPPSEELRNERNGGNSSSSNNNNDSSSNQLLSTQDSSTNPTATVGARNRIKGKNRCKRTESGMTAETVTPEPPEPPPPKIDCVICYNGIDIRNRRGYMLAPCDHLFHRDCLVQWMDVKMECPICRTALPAL